jgi:predicted DNA-binding transcriptional regulator AlpA
MRRSQATFDDPPGEQGPLLLAVDSVASLLGISSRSVWRLVSAEEFPPPIRIGGLSRWRKKDVHDWIDGRRTA